MPANPEVSGLDPGGSFFMTRYIIRKIPFFEKLADYCLQTTSHFLRSFRNHWINLIHDLRSVQVQNILKGNT